MNNDMVGGESIYWQCAMRELPRLLSMIDREAWSPSYGCCDRTYWSWKFTDFAGARYQEAICAFSFFSVSERFSEDERTHFRKLWLAGVTYWAGLQHKDGSFDEAYPFERSFAATAFTGFYVGYSLLTLASRSDEIVAEYELGLRSVVSLCEWLCENQENHGILSNHLAAAAAALEMGYQLTGNEKFRKRSSFFVDFIISKQSGEGWYEEYGGADLGYQTHTVFYLAIVWRYAGGEGLFASLDKSVLFVSRFIAPTGAVGGVFASRNTEFFMPAGFLILAHKSKVARYVVGKTMRHTDDGSLVGLSAMDPQNFLPFFNNYLFADMWLDDAKLADEMGFDFSFPDVYFKEAGMMIVSRSKYVAFINVKKGGAAHIYFLDDAGGCLRVVVDGGVWVRLDNGRMFHSQVLNHITSVALDSECIEILSPLGAFNHRLMTPLIFMLFRLVTVSTAFVPRISYLIKRVLVLVLVRRKKSVGLFNRRFFRFSERGVEISDSILGNGRLLREVSCVNFGGRFSGIHMGSSRYFTADELKQVGGDMCCKNVQCLDDLYSVRFFDALP